MYLCCSIHHHLEGGKKEEAGNGGVGKTGTYQGRKGCRGRENGVVSAPQQIQQKHRHGCTKLSDGYGTMQL